MARTNSVCFIHPKCSLLLAHAQGVGCQFEFVYVHVCVCVCVCVRHTLWSALPLSWRWGSRVGSPDINRRDSWVMGLARGCQRGKEWSGVPSLLYGTCYRLIIAIIKVTNRKKRKKNWGQMTRLVLS